MERKVRSDYQARVWIEGVGDAERRLEITPARAGWEFLSFRAYTFRAGQVIDGESAGDEMCMVLLSGAVTMEAAGQRWLCDGRESVFAGRHYAVYLPPGRTYRMTIHRDADCAYGRASAEGHQPPRLITPDEARVESGNGPGATSQITHILDPGDAEKLLCAEILTPAGGWSGAPAHHHDQADPVAAIAREEVCYYRTRPEDGWGLRRLAGDDRTRDEAVVVANGNAVMTRRGSDPVVATPGSELYTLRFLAGETSSVSRDNPDPLSRRSN